MIIAIKVKCIKLFTEQTRYLLAMFVMVTMNGLNVVIAMVQEKLGLVEL